MYFWLIQLWIPLMWIWLWYFIQRIHLCLCILRWSWLIFLNLFKHINIGVFNHLPVFHWFIIIWRCILIHKPKLYTLCNIPPLASHWLWTWNFMLLIEYYTSPCFVLIFMTLNHRLRLKSILHRFIQMSSWLHLFPWKSLFKSMPFLKSPSPYISPYHFLW